MGSRGLISGEEREGEEEEARRGLGAEEERVRGPAGKDEPEEDVAMGAPMGPAVVAGAVGKGGTADPTLAARWGRRCGWTVEA